jgi:hypothetical protein
LETRQLHEHEADPIQVRRMLKSALTALEDAGLEDVSAVTRFDAAYRAIMQCSMVALWSNGFRPATSVAGHHALMIQTLTKSIGLPPEKVRALDALRTKRNAIDYQGKDIDEASVAACIEAASALFRVLIDWLSENRPDLISSDETARWR